VVCDIELRLAAAVYPAAPFSRWYIATEIGSRNLADEACYNLLPRLARRLRLDLTAPASLGRERAIVEPNAAVLHSFAAAACRIADHHTASDEFLRYCALEKAGGGLRGVGLDCAAVGRRRDGSVPPAEAKFAAKAGVVAAEAVGTGRGDAGVTGNRPRGIIFTPKNEGHYGFRYRGCRC